MVHFGRLSSASAPPPAGTDPSLAAGEATAAAAVAAAAADDPAAAAPTSTAALASFLSSVPGKGRAVANHNETDHEASSRDTDTTVSLRHRKPGRRASSAYRTIDAIDTR